MPTRSSVGRSNITPRTLLSVPVASCGGRMPECTSTGCRRESFAFVAFFSQSALYDGCVVFFVHVLPCLRLRGA